MVESMERDRVSDPAWGRDTAPLDRAELTRRVELELDRWVEHHRELQRHRRRRAPWNREAGRQVE